jgi:hypothetical protein
MNRNMKCSPNVIFVPRRHNFNLICYDWFSPIFFFYPIFLSLSPILYCLRLSHLSFSLFDRPISSPIHLGGGIRRARALDSNVNSGDGFNYNYLRMVSQNATDS